MLFDQFEEYFLYHDHEKGVGTFDAEFPQAVNRAELRANFLLSIRDDSLARLDRFKGRIPNLFENRLQIDHLTVAAARDAVKLPIEEYNRRVPPERRVEDRGPARERRPRPGAYGPRLARLAVRAPWKQTRPPRRGSRRRSSRLC